MSDMNVVCLCGRLTKDPELRITQSGQGVCSFTVASNRNKRKDEEEAQADFLSCVAWNKTADYLVKYGHKGDRVQLQGRLQSRNYTKLTEDGPQERTAYEISALTAEFPENI